MHVKIHMQLSLSIIIDIKWFEQQNGKGIKKEKIEGPGIVHYIAYNVDLAGDLADDSSLQKFDK